MSYKNGRDILPASLLIELQKHIQGELIYIPKKAKQRAGWGEVNGTKRMIEGRNNEIYKLHQSGLKLPELTERYHLSEDSIRKIIIKEQKSKKLHAALR